MTKLQHLLHQKLHFTGSFSPEPATTTRGTSAYFLDPVQAWAKPWTGTTLEGFHGPYRILFGWALYGIWKVVMRASAGQPQRYLCQSTYFNRQWTVQHESPVNGTRGPTFSRTNSPCRASRNFLEPEVFPSSAARTG